MWYWQGQKSDYTISSVHTAMHIAAANTVSDRDSTSCYHISEHTGRFLYTSTG